MKKKARTTSLSKPAPIYERIREILESARAGVARSVNTTQVVANWLIGREIVEEEQRGQHKAGYGQQLISELSAKLQRDCWSRLQRDEPQTVSPVLFDLSESDSPGDWSHAV